MPLVWKGEADAEKVKKGREGEGIRNTPPLSASPFAVSLP